MATSTFQFTNPMLLHLDFSLPPQPPAEGIPDDVVADLHFELNVTRSEDKAEREAAVELRLLINNKDSADNENALFFAEILMGSMFRWEESVTEERASKYLSLNAPALLLSYMRPLLAQLTDLSPVPTYHIPFMDMNGLFGKQQDVADERPTDN